MSVGNRGRRDALNTVNKAEFGALVKILNKGSKSLNQTIALKNLHHSLINIPYSICDVETSTLNDMGKHFLTVFLALLSAWGSFLGLSE